MKLNLLTGILLTSLITNADNTTIGDVDMGEVKNSNAFNQIKKILLGTKILGEYQLTVITSYLL